MNLENLKRRLERLKERSNDTESFHLKQLNNPNYSDGYDIGYTNGRIAEIENIIDQIEQE
jgi:hypothetical protein